MSKQWEEKKTFDLRFSLNFLTFTSLTHKDLVHLKFYFFFLSLNFKLNKNIVVVKTFNCSAKYKILQDNQWLLNQSKLR